MMKVIIKKFGKLSVAMNSLSVYRGLLQKTLFADYLKLAEMLCSPECDYIALLKITSLYSEICKILFESSFDSDLSSFVYNSILYDENKFSRECFISDNVEVNLFNAAQNDYQSLMLLAGISSEEIIDYYFDSVIEDKYTSLNDFFKLYSEKNLYNVIKSIDSTNQVTKTYEDVTDNNNTYQAIKNFVLGGV